MSPRRLKYALISVACHQPPIQPVVLGSLQDVIASFPLNSRWALADFVTSLDDGLLVSQAISSGTAVGVSDGSCRQGRLSSGMVLEAFRNPQSRLSAANEVRGYFWPPYPYFSRLPTF